MLVRDGAPLRDLHDPEGFVAAAHQFDSDITSGRHPRAALGTSIDELIALVCDGRRTGIDAGLTLAELAQLMADLRARQAINLDGGGSTALIHHGHLLNRPYDAQDRPSGKSRAVATADLPHRPSAVRRQRRRVATPPGLTGARGDGAGRRPLLRSPSGSHSRAENDHKFAEPVALSSTQPADRPLPRRAFRLSLDLIALRARRRNQPMRSRPADQFYGGF